MAATRRPGPPTPVAPVAPVAPVGMSADGLRVDRDLPLGGDRGVVEGDGGDGDGPGRPAVRVGVGERRRGAVVSAVFSPASPKLHSYRTMTAVAGDTVAVNVIG